MLVNRELILAKIESTYNTDPTPAASTDAILVESPAWSYEGARMVERPAVRGGDTSTLKHIWGDTMMQVTFTTEIKGAGVAYSAGDRPEIDPLLRACALSATLDATVSSETYTYEPVSDVASHESITIYYYADGVRYVLTGCRGNAEFVIEAGSTGKINFTFKGHTSTPTDVALPTPTLDSLSPPVAKGSSFTIDSYAATVAGLTWATNWEMSGQPDLSATDGFGETTLTKRDVSGTFSPEMELVAAEDFDERWRANAAMALASGDIGSTQYNQFHVTMPAVSYREVAPGDRDGIRTRELGFGAATSSGDDEFSLIFD